MQHTHQRSLALPFHWPTPPVQVVLVEPEIPQNTGNIARLCAATGAPLHLVGPLGFQVHDRAVRRAGLDYWDAVDLHRHVNFEEYLLAAQPTTFYLFSTSGPRSHFTPAYHPGDALIFGCETHGLPAPLLTTWPDRVLQIPMQTAHVRSLNLANSVAIALYEALRQIAADHS